MVSQGTLSGSTNSVLGMGSALKCSILVLFSSGQLDQWCVCVCECEIVSTFGWQFVSTCYRQTLTGIKSAN